MASRGHQVVEFTNILVIKIESSPPVTKSISLRAGVRVSCRSVWSRQFGNHVDIEILIVTTPASEQRKCLMLRFFVLGNSCAKFKRKNPSEFRPTHILEDGYKVF